MEVHFIEPSVRVMFPREEQDIQGMLDRIEYAARVCYNSKVGTGDQGKFIEAKIKAGHESVVEHGWITVEVACDRGYPTTL